ncbi:hypothetical protein PINS_up023963 [Pythium insidiosum]|nr:hypothetical protein PINS_up023963 [Pythium insidiosum]
MSAYAFNLRRVAGLPQVRGSGGQQSGEEMGARHPGANRRPSSNRQMRADSLDSEASSTPSIDARLQYIVNMAAAVGKALPLHLNIQTANLTRHIAVPTGESLVGSDESQHGGSPVNSLSGGGNVKMSESIRSSSSSGSERSRSRHRGNFPVLPPPPFGSVDFLKPPGRAFGEPKGDQTEDEERADDTSLENLRVPEVDDHGDADRIEGEERRISDGYGEHSNGSAQSRSRDPQLEVMMQRLAVLPPPPFEAFDMSRPPPPLQWSFSSHESAEEHEDSVEEDEPQAQPRHRRLNESDPAAIESQQEGTGKEDGRTGNTVEAQGGQTSEGPALTLAEAFRRRHPNFGQRSQATELLKQRREQVQRRSSEVSDTNCLTAGTPNSRERRPMIPRQTASAGPSQPDSLTPEQSRLLERLASGERAKMSAQEMRERTKRLYNKLPEVLERKRQEEVLERRRQRLAEMREREKARRLMQKQRRDRSTAMASPHR